MTEKQAYVDLAERYIKAAEGSILHSKVHEAASFESYHAFESIAGAFNCHIGQAVPRKHVKKLNAFVVNYRSNKITRIHPVTISGIAIQLNGMRNKCLYPFQNGSDYSAPKDQLTAVQARDQTRKIKGIIAKMIQAF